MKNLILSFLKDDRGVTAIEYTLIAGGVAVAIIVGAGSLGSKLNTTFTDMSGNFKGK